MSEELKEIGIEEGDFDLTEEADDIE